MYSRNATPAHRIVRVSQGSCSGARYVGEMYGDAANRVRVSGYTLVDVGASYRLPPQTTLALNAQNLFDRDYTATCYGDDADGCYAGLERTVVGSLKYNW